MVDNTSGASASIRLAVYHFARRITGPVNAIRLARFFARSAAA